MTNRYDLLKKTLVSYLKTPAAICLLVNVAIIFLILLLLRRLPPVVPLLYGQPQGDEQLVGQLWLTLPPLMATAFTVLNLILGKIVKDNFLQNVLIALMIGATLLSTITVVKIIFLVGNL